jgi:hypothetical protein
MKMSLKNLFGWNEKEVKAQSACGTACGASDNKTEAPVACGAADKPEEAPAACGAADKPSACGTACGASDK